MAVYTWLWGDATYGTIATTALAGSSSASVLPVQNSFPVPSAGQAFSVVLNPSLSSLPDNATTERIIVTGNTSNDLSFASNLVHNHSPGEYCILVADSASLTGLQGEPSQSVFVWGAPSPGVFDVSAAPTGYPPTGQLVVDSATISYSGISGSSFTGCASVSGQEKKNYF